MLTQQAVRYLHDAVGTGRVLSVYLDAHASDPAERRGWRVRLNGMIRALEGNAESDADKQGLQAALKHLDYELAAYEGALPGRGWLGFATPERLIYAGTSPAPFPDLARWATGVHITPYLRALKQARPVLVAIGDQRRVRLLRYQDGELEQVAAISPSAGHHRDVDGVSKRASSRSGTRGVSRTDAAQRAKEQTLGRLLHDVHAHLANLRGGDVLLLAGGSREVTTGIARDLPGWAAGRTAELGEITADATLAEIRQAVEAAASVISARLHVELVDEVIDTTRSDGRACVGPEHTDRALQAGAVDTLVVSRNFSQGEPDLANHFCWMAFNEGATVEEVGGEAATKLDAEGGIGARLRFSV